MDKDKKKSLARSKTTTLRLGDILTTAGLSALDPSLGLGYKLVKLVKDHGREWYENRAEDRILEFHRKVFEGEIDDQEKERIKNKEVSEDDYFLLLKYVLEDEQDAKVDIYAKIFRAIALNEISIQYKAHIARTARDLTWNQFELMKEIFLVGNENYFTGQQVATSLTKLLVKDPRDNPIASHDIQQLIRLGFLLERLQGAGLPNFPQKTMLLDEIVKAVYDSEELSLSAAKELVGKKF